MSLTSIAEVGGVATLSVHLMNADPGMPPVSDVTASLAFTGLASLGVDFLADETATIYAGSTVGTLLILGKPDSFYENDEAFVVAIDYPAGSPWLPVPVSGLIADNNTLSFSLSLSDDDFGENGGSTTLTLAANVDTLPPDETYTLTLDLSGEATVIGDYTVQDSIIIIALATQSSATAVFTGVDDNVLTGDQSVVINLKPPFVATSPVIASLLEDDVQVSLVASGTQLNEAGGEVTLTLALSSPSPKDVTVYLSYSGDASHVDDYETVLDGTVDACTMVIIPAGSPGLKTFIVRGLDDLLAEGNQSIIAQIVSATNAAVDASNDDALLTIIDDDSLVLSNTEAEGIAVSLAEGSTGSFTVGWFFDTDATRTAADYQALIQWGDTQTSDSQSGQVSFVASSDPRGGFDIRSTHAYAASGSYEVTITLSTLRDTDLHVETVYTTANVTASVFTVSGIPAAFERNTLGDDQVIAEIVDPEIIDISTLANYSATIAWGDGNYSPGILEFVAAVGLSPAKIQVLGSQPYSASGVYLAETTVKRIDGVSHIVTSQLTVTPWAPVPVLASLPNPFDAVLNVSKTFSLLTFATPLAAAFTAHITWGDGSPEELIPLPIGSAQLQVDHAYQATGLRLVEVILDEDSGDSEEHYASTVDVLATTTVRVDGISAIVDLDGAPADVVLGTFYDAGITSPPLTSDYSVQIRWGDGTETSGGFDYVSPGVLSVRGLPPYGTMGSYLAEVTVQRTFDGAESVAISSVSVVSASAPVRLSSTPMPVQSDAGESINAVLLSFMNPLAGNYLVTIYWGDELNPADYETYLLYSGDTSFNASHIYNDAGHYSVHVMLTAGGGFVEHYYTTAHIAAVSAFDVEAPEIFFDLDGRGESVPVASVSGLEISAATDPSAYSATIDWGDGVSETKSLRYDDVTGPELVIDAWHAYDAPGNYLRRITVTGPGGVIKTDDGLVHVTKLVSSVDPIVGVEGSSLSLRQLEFAVPTDRNYRAEIHWGNGEPVTIATLATGATELLVTHEFPDLGHYAVRIDLIDLSDSTARSYFTTAHVTDAGALVGTGRDFIAPVNVEMGDVYLGFFTNPTYAAEAASDYDVMIEWGDGTTSGGDVYGSAGKYFVAGTHTYLHQDAWYEVRVHLQEVGGIDNVVVVNVYVSPVEEGDPLPSEELAWLRGAEPTRLTSDYTYTKEWGDSTPDFIGGFVASDLTGGWAEIDSDRGAVSTETPHTFGGAGGYLLIQRVLDSVTALTAQADEIQVVADVPLVNASASGSLADIPVGQALASDTVLASFTDSGATGVSYLADIDFGDGTLITGVAATLETGVWYVRSGHLYADAGDYRIAVHVYSAAMSPGFTRGVGSITGFTGPTTTSSQILTTLLIHIDDTDPTSVVGTAIGYQLREDPDRATLLPIGQAIVALNTGGLRLEHELDFDLSPGTEVGRNPALVYNSETVAPRPIIAFDLNVDPNALPNSISVEMKWGNSTTWDAAQSISLSGFSGSTLHFAIQKLTPFTQSGVYKWTAQIKQLDGAGAPFGDPIEVTGIAQVVVRDDSPIGSRPNGPFGAGWWIDGINKLVDVTSAASGGPEGTLFIFGNGDSRFFAKSPAVYPSEIRYDSPAEDFGILRRLAPYHPDLASIVTAGKAGYLYTAKDQTRYYFDSRGNQILIRDRHGDEWKYQWNSFDIIGGYLTIFTPDGASNTVISRDTISSITISEPGSRVVNLGLDPLGRLTGIKDVDGTNRSFSYTGIDALIRSAVWSPLDTQFNYAANGILNSVNMGNGRFIRIMRIL